MEEEFTAKAQKARKGKRKGDWTEHRAMGAYKKKEEFTAKAQKARKGKRKIDAIEHRVMGAYKKKEEFTAKAQKARKGKRKGDAIEHRVMGDHKGKEEGTEKFGMKANKSNIAVSSAASSILPLRALFAFAVKFLLLTLRLNFFSVLQGKEGLT